MDWLVAKATQEPEEVRDKASKRLWEAAGAAEKALQNSNINLSTPSTSRITKTISSHSNSSEVSVMFFQKNWGSVIWWSLGSDPKARASSSPSATPHQL